MALSDIMAALFGRRRTYAYVVREARATVLGMGPSELYRKQPALRAVISFLADNVAGVPVKCYVRQADDDRPRDTTSDLALLLQRPSRGMTTHELVRATVSDYLLYGTALWAVLPERGTPSGWSARHIPWSWVSQRETENGFDPSAYVVVNPYTGGRATFDAADCIRFASYDPAGTLDSSSPVEALREVLSEQVSAWNFRNSVWRNGGRVSAYLYRPKDTPWGDGARDRFSKSWKNKFSGEEGTDTGGTPLLEDGMELRTVQFNAREAEWAEATRLTREDVAAVYHVNPALIWHTDGQTYASAKDNARALYADTLAPIMDMLEERLNGFLVPMLGMDPARSYVEFDLSAKLAASFEEQAGVLQSSAGGPWMTRNEVRARMNLPALPGADELIVPLNVSEGGLASPNDTDSTVERYNGAPVGYVQGGLLYMLPQAKEAGELPECGAVEVEERVCEPVATKADDAAPFDKYAPELRIRVKTSPKVTRRISGVLRDFYIRQSTYMQNALSAIQPDVDDLDAAIQEVLARRWTNWVNELSGDLARECGISMEGSAMRTMSLLGVDPDELDRAVIQDYVRNLCKERAKGIVANAFSELRRDLPEASDWTPDSARRSAGKSYGSRMAGRVERNATSLSTDVVNAGAHEGARQSGVRCQKEWVALGHNTRDEHAELSGTRVPIDGVFHLAGGTARWPGDSELPPEQTCNCHCRIDIVADGKAVYRRSRTDEVADRLGLEDFDEGALDNATLRCQRALGLGDRLWDDLTNSERKDVLREMRSRDREWLATGTCRVTREAANPAVPPFRQEHPDMYAEWQDMVSRFSRLAVSREQMKHIQGTEAFDTASETSSYFIVDGDTDEEKLAALRTVVDGLAGSGEPKLHGESLREVVSTSNLGSYAVNAGRAGDGLQIHYAPAQDGGTFHVVPWARYVP